MVGSFLFRCLTGLLDLSTYLEWNVDLCSCGFERCTAGLILVGLYLIYDLGLLLRHCNFLSCILICSSTVCTLFSVLQCLPVVSGLQCVPYLFVPFFILFFVVIYHLLILLLSVHTYISLCAISLGFVFLFSLILWIYSKFFICKYFIVAIGIAIRCIALLFVTLWSYTVTRDTMKHLKIFRVISNEMPVYFLSYVDAILVVWRCIQRNFLMLTFMSKCFLKSLWQRETQLSIFWKIIAWTVKFSLTNLHVSWRSWL